MGISAQVSIYPLRQPHLSPAIDLAIRIFRKFGLIVHPGPMSTLIEGEDEKIFAALQEVLRETAKLGNVVMVVTLSNACPVPGEAQ